MTLFTASPDRERIPDPPASVADLYAQWHLLARGQSVPALPISRMPPWQDLCKKLNWNIFTLTAGEYFARKHASEGVYRLIALSSEGELDRPVTLPRVCGNDESGTLYIGEASQLHDRANQFRRRRPTHQTARMFSRIPILRAKAPALAIAFYETVMRGGVESDLIHAYMNTYGEAPPMNYRIRL